MRLFNSEGELAFVLCHEMAHYYLAHREKSILKHAKHVHSKEYKEELNEVLNSEYGKRERLKDLLKDETYGASKHSREHESSADSLGLLFLKNTNYSLLDAISCINLLDVIDKYKYVDQVEYYDILGSQEYSFKKIWLEREESLFDDDAEGEEWFNQDSLKTHPDCDQRAAKLKKMIVGLSAENRSSFLQDSIQFFDMREMMDYEVILSWKKYKNFGKGLFYALKKLTQDKHNKELIGYVGDFLYNINKEQIEHRLGDFVDKPSLANDEEYNQLLELLDNIRLSELRLLGYNYFKKHADMFDLNKEFLNQAISFASFVDEEVCGKWKEIYKNKYTKE